MKSYENFADRNERNLPTLMKPKLDIANETDLTDKNWTEQNHRQQNGEQMACGTLALTERSICGA